MGRDASADPVSSVVDPSLGVGEVSALVLKAEPSAVDVHGDDGSEAGSGPDCRVPDVHFAGTILAHLAR